MGPAPSHTWWIPNQQHHGSFLVICLVPTVGVVGWILPTPSLGYIMVSRLGTFPSQLLLTLLFVGSLDAMGTHRISNSTADGEERGHRGAAAAGF